MTRVLKGYKPERVYHYFEEVAQIPRNSFQEEKISNYLVNFAKEHDLDVYQDEHWNVIINKPASKGYENRKKVILQGHMDMVCVKEANVEHDFMRDPIELVVDGDYVKAKGTTLGADDGNAVSIILAVLEDNEKPHPALQAIITTAEETGMVGAVNLNGNLIDGDFLIGLDYSNNTSVLVSCAGSCQNVFSLEKQVVSMENIGTKVACEISLNGLLGGHSGIQIILGRANAIVVLAEILSNLKTEMFYELSDFVGGDKENTIPAWAKATVVIPKEKVKELADFVGKSNTELAKEYIDTDPDIRLQVTEVKVPRCCLSERTENKLLQFIDLIPNGLQTYLDVARTLAKSSSNLGVLEDDGSIITLFAHSRSNTEYQHDQILRRFKEVAALCDVKYVCNHRVPAWEYDRKAVLPSKVQTIWEKVRGARPPIAIFHAGVESGVFIKKMQERGKHLEAISIGIHNVDVHSPRERMEIKTLGQAFELVQAILENLN
jgi:dipeptidase D